VSENKRTIILVHGLWVRSPVFFLHQRWLEKKGFAVRRFSYPSVSNGLRQNAEALKKYVAATDGDTIHLVGHSLGGLVALAMLARYPEPRLGRMVLMGSPCIGCHAAVTMRRIPWLGKMVGCSLNDWLAMPRPPLPGNVEIGVLAGDLGIGLGRLIPGLPKPNDGVISVAETRLPEAVDSIVLPVSHTGMLISRTCSNQVAAFLESGKFLHG